MSLALLGIGTSLPDHAIAQQDAATLAASFANATPGRERALEALYRKSGIRSRGSVLLDDPGEEGFSQEFFQPAEATADGGPSTGERMARYALEASRLAVDAARRAVAAAGIEPDAVASWAVHPGGPRILTAVEAALELPPDALAASRGVLAEHGNMSSATILFVLDRLRAADAQGPCVALAFGPGLTVEMAVLER